ncbi:MAG: HAD family hydrolase [Promethearchaeota archaeon]
MTLPATIKGILFDLDGTLVKLPNLDKFFDTLLVDVLQDYGIVVSSQEERLALWHSGGDFEKVIRGWGIKDYGDFIHNFDERDLIKRKRLAKEGVIRVFPDVTALPMLHEQVKLGIVTNTPPVIASFEIEFFGLGQYFDDLVMLGTSEQHLAKPEPDGLHRCLRNLGVKEEHALMVGDSRSDILGGQNAGVATVFVRRPNQSEPRGLKVPPDLFIDDLHELLDLL